jgi:F-type H+-transporting ATPase subunit a
MTPSAGRGCIYLLVFFAVVGIFLVAFPVGLSAFGIGMAVPVITVYGEPYFPGDKIFGVFEWTNTLTALVIVDAFVLTIFFIIGRSLQRGDKIPRGFRNAFEAMVGYLYNLAKATVGAAQAKKIFPVVATFFILVLVANWTKLIPGVESVGIVHCAEEGYSSYAFHADDTPVYRKAEGEASVDSAHPTDDSASHGEEQLVKVKEAGDRLPFITGPKVEKMLDSGEKGTEESYHACEYKYLGLEGEDGKYKKEYEHLVHEGREEEADRLAVTPFVRGAATDLNFTLALALTAMFFVQFFGVRALGFGYFAKFVNLPAVGNVTKRPMGVMDFVVGALEILSEFSKIISFAFRLFGVIFAGGILLIVISFLTSGAVPMLVYILEFFIGAIQAFVFFILPLVLIKLAMISHHHEDHEDHGHGEHKDHGHSGDHH